MLGTISAFAFGHRETEKNLCRGGRSQDLLASSLASKEKKRRRRKKKAMPTQYNKYT